MVYNEAQKKAIYKWQAKHPEYVKLQARKNSLAYYYRNRDTILANLKRKRKEGQDQAVAVS